ncbi:hypothetical protein [Acidocella aminolytica]|uniref:hypothetical protein n=1 Tax=Acidocella aminolytica TaxID=33998 RepID=UPI001114A765|nr:hypothetical protein [Acidocella aminolytica]
MTRASGAGDLSAADAAKRGEARWLAPSPKRRLQLGSAALWQGYAPPARNPAKPARAFPHPPAV